MNFEFNYELWYPISMPSMTQIIKVSVWDEGVAQDNFLGQVITKLNKIMAGETAPEWHNLYGAQNVIALDSKEMLQAVAATARTRMNQIQDADFTDFEQVYNNVPNSAPSFKGRVLLGFRLESEEAGHHGMSKKLPSKGKKAPLVEVKPFRLKIKHRLTEQQEPRTIRYFLKALVVQGCELPAFHDISTQAVAAAATLKETFQVRRVYSFNMAITFYNFYFVSI